MRWGDVVCWKIQGLKRCANDGKFVFGIQMKPLEKVSRNHLHFFKDVLKVMSFYCGGFQETNTFHQKHPNEKWYVSRKRDGPLSFIYFKGRIRRSLFNQFT